MTRERRGRRLPELIPEALPTHSGTRLPRKTRRGCPVAEAGLDKRPIGKLRRTRAETRAAGKCPRVEGEFGLICFREVREREERRSDCSGGLRRLT